MEDICIFTACTEDYLSRALSLYNSLNKYNSNISFFISLINVKKDNFFEKIKNNKLCIEYDNVKYTGDKLKAYASCVRAKIYPKILDKHKIVFWMDADTIIRKNLDELFSKLLKADIILFKTLQIDEKTAKKIGKYKTGIIGIKSSNKTKVFLNKWNNSIFNSNKELKWFLDQLSITDLLTSNNDLIVSNLELKYIDWTFQKNSYIWVGKGQRKNTKIYLNEESKYK
tara:strand:+ start:174 stop:854 length:681 start_codon:yes stop_codon:yes gene_type:complete